MGIVPVSPVSSESSEACDQGDAEAAGCEERSALWHIDSHQRYANGLTRVCQVTEYTV